MVLLESVVAGGLTEVGKQAFQPPGGGGVPFGLTGPATLASVLDELLLDLQQAAQPWGVLGVVTNLAQVR